VSRQATATAFGYFAAAYPTARKADETTRDVWAEALAGFPGTTILAAAKRWTRTETRFPTLAAFLDCCGALSPANTRSLERGHCPSCDGLGWEFTNLDGPGMVARCRHGCRPPSPEPRGIDGPDAQERDVAHTGIAHARKLLAGLRGSLPTAKPVLGPFAREEEA
jgi:hypothetical protein